LKKKLHFEKKFHFSLLRARSCFLTSSSKKLFFSKAFSKKMHSSLLWTTRCISFFLFFLFQLHLCTTFIFQLHFSFLLQCTSELHSCRTSISYEDWWTNKFQGLWSLSESPLSCWFHKFDWELLGKVKTPLWFFDCETLMYLNIEVERDWEVLA